MKLFVTKKQNAEYLDIITKSNKYDRAMLDKYWFSAHKCLEPIFEFFAGSKNVSNAREEFQDKLLKEIDTHRQYIRDLQLENEKLKYRVKYFESIIKEGHNDKC